MKKLLLVVVLALSLISLSLIAGVALAQEGDVESLVVPESEAKEGDIIEVSSLSEARASHFIALGTSVKRVKGDFKDEAKALGLGELDLEEGKILIVKGVHIPVLFAPVKGDKVQAFTYIPENMLSYGREAMGIILEIVEGKKMTIKMEGKEVEMDLETGKAKVVTMGALGSYGDCILKCVLKAAPYCLEICVEPELWPACLACGGAAAAYCSIKCAW